MKYVFTWVIQCPVDRAYDAVWGTHDNNHPVYALPILQIRHGLIFPPFLNDFGEPPRWEAITTEPIRVAIAQKISI